MSILLSARELSKEFGHGPVFAKLSLDVRVGERIGLIGPNGAGKSTLLKILAGRDSPDEGAVSTRRGIRLGYVPQDDTFKPGLSAREVVLARLTSDDLEEHERETRASIALTRVGFDDEDRQAATLSGGWRKRLALARELACDPDVLLLDEPTNHLDLPAVIWLERLLRSASFGYIVATHDRAFLRAVADDVIELSRSYPGGVFRSAGGYDAFADNRDRFLEGQERERAAIANQVRKETEWLSRKESAQRKKSRSRIAEAADRRAELADLTARTTQGGAAGIDFVGTGRQTRKLLAASGLSKSLGGRALFSGLDVFLAPGTRIGLLGSNGSGKSTLLKVLAGELTPDSGTIARADALRTVVFEQGRTALDPSLPLRRAISPGGDTVTYRDRQVHVGGWAKQFLFRPEQLDIEVGALSGGEQARVRIAQLMLKPADVLFLDEPTNDLDIPSLEVLEESLEDFPGAVVLVSHDRELTDRLCTEIIGLDGRGGSASFGSVSQWLTAVERSANKAADPERPVAGKTVAAKEKTKKLSFKEQKEWEGMEAAVLAAETAVAARQAAVEQAATAGHTALTEACRLLEETQHSVERLYARWQELEARRSS